MTRITRLGMHGQIVSPRVIEVYDVTGLYQLAKLFHGIGVSGLESKFQARSLLIGPSAHAAFQTGL